MTQDVKYYFDENQGFVIENYNFAKPFSNFFPGIAGIWGIPMWVFYVNRGQGIASFGIESKDKAIMEFQPANKSYRLTSTQGFRTFIKVKKGNTVRYYEPFQTPSASPFKLRQLMRVTSHDLSIEETNLTLGIQITVNYFTVPEEPFSGLVRHVTVKNISRGSLSVEMIDGLPVIIPYGQNDWVMKNMCRTIEAWYKVRNLDRKAAYYQLNVEAADTPQVKHIKEGNFYFAFDPKARPGTLLEPIVEAAAVFGAATDFLVPAAFLGATKFTVKTPQTDNRTPSAMSHIVLNLKSQAVREVVSVIGFAHSVEELNGFVEKVTAKGFIEAKRQRNRDIIEEIKSLCFTHSASSAFNAYAGQTFLDNVMRGGLPISLKTSEGQAVFNVYSRKHGDIERDYNFFRLSPTYLSQGNGNYRDVNQNRRNDVWFNNDLKDSAIVNFMSLIQADGYNPLVVCGMTFAAEDSERTDKLLSKHVKKENQPVLKAFLKKGFMPGDLFNFLNVNNIRLRTSPVEFLTEILGICQKYETAQHGEGFWVDHWTYNFDLIESYLSLYPENLRSLLLENRQFTFFHNSVYVLPRERRFILTDRGVRQYESLHEGKEKKDQGTKLRVRHGEGEVYFTNLLTKLLSLIANKAATFDPSGIGIEMEANKPGWYDSLNGLPGLLGSSICETYELKRYAGFILKSLNQLSVSNEQTYRVYEELGEFIKQLSGYLGERGFEYWKHSNDIKEKYREQVRHGLSGVEIELTAGQIRMFLEGITRKVDEGIRQAESSNGLVPTYVYHKVTHYELVDERQAGKEGAHVRPLEFKRHDLPLFLEGFVHALRCEEDKSKALNLHRQVRKSALFDKKLGMYKLNADITSETEEIGRTRVFPRGWLENESIWLHMEYKYLLELLRLGLYDEFYADFATSCIAFLDPAVYGRSVTENSSFIVSSAHPDESIHGQGNVARLSGSTAELIHIWMFMNAGCRPFRMNEKGALQLVFEPALKGFFFTKVESKTAYLGRDGGWRTLVLPANTYAFNFMGRTLVVYHNPSRRDTFGSSKAVIKTIALTSQGKKLEITGSVIPSPHAQDVRAGKIDRIDIFLA